MLNLLQDSSQSHRTALQWQRLRKEEENFHPWIPTLHPQQTKLREVNPTGNHSAPPELVLPQISWSASGSAFGSLGTWHTSPGPGEPLQLWL